MTFSMICNILKQMLHKPHIIAWFIDLNTLQVQHKRYNSDKLEVCLLYQFDYSCLFAFDHNWQTKSK